MSQGESLFEPIDHESVVELVIEQIEEMILQGVLREGSRLPSERDLAERMTVSRPKVRQALKQLESDGLINVRHGEGTFVAQLSGQAMSPALIGLYARHGLAFYDYLEYRREQEAFAAKCAAERATAADHENITNLIEALERAQQADDPSQSEIADVQFHSAIVNASHNAMLIHMMTSIYDLTRRGVFYNRRYLRSIDGSGDQLLSQHKDIAEAVLKGDPAAAEASARAHLDFVERSFRVGEDRERRERYARKRLLAAPT